MSACSCRLSTTSSVSVSTPNLHHRDWSPELRDALRREERLAFAWDLQQEEELLSALALGADAVYSDHVDRMQSALAKHSLRAG